MNSEIYPIYYFLNIAGIENAGREQAVNLIQARSKNKAKVITRLNKDSRLEGKKNSYSFKSPKLGDLRKKYYDALTSNKVIQVSSETDCRVALESIFSLEKDGFEVEFVKEQLHVIFQKFYPFKKGGINYVFRWALTYLDNISHS